MAKNHYVVDAENQLLVTHPKKGNKKFPIPGRFVLEKNGLAYNLNLSPAWKRELSLPGKIRFSGNWSIDSNHNLALLLWETKNQHRGDILTLRGEILDFRSNALLFALTRRTKSGRELTRILKLGGRWQADKYNHLTFLVKKKETQDDVLTLRGIWQVNRQNLLTYNYEKTRLKTKRRLERSILFQGFWEINSRDRLTYILDLKEDSYFAFRAQAETPNLVGKKGVIKYRLGIGASKRKKPPMQTVSLFGTWRFGRKGDLSFDIDYGKGKIEAITFGAQVYFTKRDKVVLALENKRGEPLGINVSFQRRFIKTKAKAFLGLERKGKESRIEGGVKLSW